MTFQYIHILFQWYCPKFQEAVDTSKTIHLNFFISANQCGSPEVNCFVISIFPNKQRL